jgi:hypothetical protein
MYFLGNMMDQNSTTTNDDLDQLFADLPAGDLGNNFLLITRLALVSPILLAAESHDHYHVDSQWVYMVTDTRRGAANVTSFLQMGKDGYNLAFVYNTSLAEGGGGCQGGLTCLLEEMVQLMAGSIEEVLLKELETFDEVSIEEWEIIMPSLQVQKAILSVHC